jgi:MSHA biogenesis protein MshQ
MTHGLATVTNSTAINRRRRASIRRNVVALVALGGSLLLPLAAWAQCTNCTITTVGSDTVLTFTQDGTFTPPTGIASVQYLVVGGGGGGGGVTNTNVGGTGGGGAGGLQTATGFAVTPGNTYSITVGAGGNGASCSGGTCAAGTNGGDSIFDTIVATGGGRGGYVGSNNGATGGSGGGGRLGGTGGAGTGGQGNAGGNGDGTSAADAGAGGGGGAGGAGVAASNNTGGAGGAGAASTISGASVTYACGGGGGGYFGSTPAGGAGAGGCASAGSAPGARGAGTSAAANLGGGGGGASGSGSGVAFNGGDGGSGIVVIRYSPNQSQTASPGSCTSLGGGGTNWSNPARAETSNNSYATANVDGSTTDPLQCVDFGFSLPLGSTVTGVEVFVERRSSSTANGGSRDASLFLVKGGASVGANRATATIYTTGDVSEGHGSSSDLWGTTWTVAEINAADFGTVFTATKPSGAGGAHTISVDHIYITVYYTIPPTVVTPGSFNAFETATGAGAITGVVRTKVAGSAFGLDVVSISGGAQQAAFTDQVIVELLGNNTLGVTLDASNCPTTFTLVQTVATNPTITGGRSTVNFAAVPNSWRDVRVRVRWPTASPTVVGCSTDNFAIRPSSLMVSATDATWTTAGNARTLDNTAASGGTVHKAGQPFRVTAVPQPGTVTQYAGAPTISSVTCLSLAGMTGCSNGTLALPAGGWSGTGTRVNDTATYSEVGAFTLALEDATFASVDNADSSVAERVIPQTAAIQAGRFVPDRFVVAPANAPQFRTFGAACAGARSFTYVGQSFGYVTTPVALVTAQNAAGITTANYREALWKITTAAPSDVTQAYAAGTGPALDVSLATNAPTVTPANNGTGTVTVSALDRIAHTRPAAPIAAFNADISLTITVRDDSESDGQITTTTATPFSSVAFDSGAQFRFGRLQLGAAAGSQLVALSLPVEVQYWNGSAFVTNAADNCTTLGAANVGLGNFIGLVSGDTTPSISGAFSSGRKTLTLSPPGGSKLGTVDVVINLNATAGAFSSCTALAPPPAPTAADLVHLRGRWCGASYDRDAMARARFGVYQGVEEVIFVRENY